MNDFSTLTQLMDDESTRAFVRQHRTDDVRQLALQSTGKAVVNLPFVLDQIAGWQMARTKLPAYAAHEGIVYPPHLNMEQCSSEATARYKAALVSRLLAADVAHTMPADDVAHTMPADDVAHTMPAADVAHTMPADKVAETMLVDLTGGFGIDFSFLAPLFGKAVYVERNENLCAIARHNFNCLGLTHFEAINADGVAYLHQRVTEPADSSHRLIVFIDPARRDANGHKVFSIEDCTPDVLALKDRLMAVASCVLLKLSPMLDWHAAARAFRPYCRAVHIVSVANECKELLLVLTPSVATDDAASSIRLVCANDAEIFEQTVSFDLTPSNTSSLIGTGTAEHRAAEVNYEPLSIDALVGAVLCVPNASIMKAGVFSALSHAFGVTAVDRDSHLFIGRQALKGFPGKQFRILGITTLNKRELRQHLSGMTQANIAVRNFPQSVAELRKRLKLKDGGSCYLFATTMQGRHIIFITQPADGC